MAQSQIVINGITGSYYEAVIGSAVTLDNDGDGGESTILWVAATGSQPSGSYDGFTDPVAFSTTLTGSKEGNYLVLNIVDADVSLTSSAIIAFRHQKSNLSSPAAGEKTERSGSFGWARAQQELTSVVNDMLGEGQFVVGLAQEALQRGDLIRPSGSLRVQPGLPGEERLLEFAKVSGEATGSFQSSLYVVEGTSITGSDIVVSGSTAGIPGDPASGSFFIARHTGLFGPLTSSLDAKIGDDVFARSDGIISPFLDVVDRKIGTIIDSGSEGYYIHFDGTADSRPGGASGFSIGAPINGGTANRVVYEDGSNQVAENANLIFDGTDLTFGGSIQAADANGPAILNEAASTINPTIIPDRANLTTGLSSAANNLYCVVAGLPRLTFGNISATATFSNLASVGILQATRTSGTPNAFKITGAPHTNLADADATSALFDLSPSINFVDVTTDQTAVRILAPTYTSDDGGGDTIAVASTLFIDAAPTGDTNVTITDPRVINAAPDTDSTFVFGRAAFSSPVTDTAYFSHFDQREDLTHYAVRAEAGGNTSVNGFTQITFAVGGNAEVFVDSSSMRPNIDVTGLDLGTTSRHWGDVYGANFFTKDANGPAMLNEAPAFNNPTLCPDRSDTTGGIGAVVAGAVSIIAGGIEKMRYTSSAISLRDDVLASGFKIEGIGPDNVAASSTDADVGLSCTNDTAATAGAQQYSPMFMLEGQGWKTNVTASSQEVQFAQQIIPVQGAANPTGAWHLFSNINSAGFVDRFSVDSAGDVSVIGDISVAGTYIDVSTQLELGGADEIDGNKLSASFGVLATSGSVTPDAVTHGTVWDLVLSDDVQIQAPTSMEAGMTVLMKVTQHATTPDFAVTYDSVFKWPSGVAPVLALTSGSIDIVSGLWDGTSFLGSFVQDMS